MAGWQLALAAYSFDLSHRPGKLHGNADGLSRPSKLTMIAGPEDMDLTFPHFVGYAGQELTGVFPVAAKCQFTQDETSPLPNGFHWPTNSTELTAQAVLLHTGAITHAELVACQGADPTLQAIIAYLMTPTPKVGQATHTLLEASRCIMANHLLYIWVMETRSTRQSTLVPRIWLPTALQTRALRLCHDDPKAGHYDAARTLHRLSAVYWWPGIWQSTQEWVQTCLTCQKHTTPRLQDRLPRRPGLRPHAPFQHVAMDVTELATGKGTLAHVLVFLDLFTRWVELVIFNHCPTAAEVTEQLLNQVVSRHGVPELLLSDNGSNMAAQLVKDVCALLATRHITTSPYCPQMNGAVERFNRTFKSILAKVAQEKPQEWQTYIPAVLLAYRTACHASLGDTPFFMLYGRDPWDPLAYLTTAVGGVDTAAYRQQLHERLQFGRAIVTQAMQEKDAKQQLTQTQSSRQIPNLADLVLRRRQGVRNNHTLQGVAPTKLQDKWEGPFRVLRRLGPLTYEVQRVGTPDVERAHARHLKVFLPREGPLPTLGHTTTAQIKGAGEEGEKFHVSKITSHKWCTETQQPLYKVRWQGYTAPNDTWEPHHSLEETAAGALTDYLKTLASAPAPGITRKRPR